MALNHSENPGTGAAARAGALPAVSVVVLNFNGAAIVGRCLQHLFEQTFDDFEIVVVDNGSSDSSLRAMEPYLGRGRLAIVRSARNLGVAAGRNLGMMHARGRIVAFIDNDGYADPRWLEAIVAAFAADPAVGAVGSLVFFDRNKLVLNSAGGTANLQGYGTDLCFNTPYEFAALPREILYPMGCGMAVRADVLRRIGPLDARLFNYYEDLELGVRVWKSGLKVVLAPDAWIDHSFGSADRILGNKAALCERNRVRSVLKYYPWRHLLRWLRRELAMWRATEPRWRRLAARAYLWNLYHLGSALVWRTRFAGRWRSFWPLLEATWGRFPATIADSRCQASLAHCGAELICDGERDTAHLLYGWWPVQAEGGRRYRWSGAQAAILFKLRRPVHTCVISLMSAIPPPIVTMAVRRFGELQPAAHGELTTEPGWQTREMRCRLEPGAYEAILLTEPTHLDAWGRTVGVAVASIRFD
jgi:GT2 family glycosyltransferase